MAVVTKTQNGKISATYSTPDGSNVIEPLAYTRFNLADPSTQLTAYSEELATDVTLNKSVVAEKISNVAKGIASLSKNSFQSVKINYEVKIEDGGE